MDSEKCAEIANKLRDLADELESMSSSEYDEGEESSPSASSMPEKKSDGGKMALGLAAIRKGMS